MRDICNVCTMEVRIEFIENGCHNARVYEVADDSMQDAITKTLNVFWDAFEGRNIEIQALTVKNY